MKQRQANFELMRIVLMLFIVSTHAICYGLNIGGVYSCETNRFLHDCTGTTNYIILQFIQTLVATGVNCFVLMTGYFMYNTIVRWDRIKKIWKQTAFYSISIGIIALLINNNVKVFGDTLFPIITNQYWFVTCYLAIIAIAPYVAILTSNINKKQYQILLFILFIINFNPYHWTFGCFNNRGYDVSWFVFLFLIGSYIRTYNPLNQLKHHWGKLYIFSSVLLTSYIIFKYRHLNPYELRSTFLIEYNGWTLFTSVMLFMFFKNMDIKNVYISKYICALAPYTFAVYLISDNGFLRQKIWQEWFLISDYLESMYLIPLLLCYILVIYAICCIIDVLKSQITQGIFKLDI